MALLSSFLFATMVSKPQDPVTVGTITAVVKKAVIYSYYNREKIKWFFGGMKHVWWYCRYQDGFTTFNDFRSYRTSMDAYNYFVLGNGDCDAVYDDIYGRQQHICYDNPWLAQKYAESHGPIVDIGYQDENGYPRSLLSY